MQNAYFSRLLLAHASSQTRPGSPLQTLTPKRHWTQSLPNCRSMTLNLRLRVICVLGTLLLGTGIPVSADIIKVTYVTDPGTKLDTVTVELIKVEPGEKTANRQIKLNGQDGNTGGSSQAVFKNVSSAETATVELVKDKGTETWPNLADNKKEGKGVQITSLREAGKENVGNSLNQSNNLPFIPSPGIFPDGTGGFFAQFQFANTSTSTAYYLSSFTIYTGLNLAFFDQLNFNSTIAIASGSLFYDATAEGQQFTINADDGTPFGPFFTFPMGSVDGSTYSLFTGVASPILPGGMLGPSTAFSIGLAPVPEPSSLVPLCFIVATIYIYYFLRFGRTTT